MMSGKRIRSVISGLLIAVLILCSGGCAGEPADGEQLTEIIIPQSYLQFTGADADDTAEAYREYCEESEIRESDVVLKVTDEQKDDIIEMNQDFIDRTLSDFKDENPEYSYELAEDYNRIVYAYDENIDNVLQAQLLMGVTSMYALNGIIKNNIVDWSVEITIENCHTGKIVAHGELPENTLTFGENEWRESYE